MKALLIIAAGFAMSITGPVWAAGDVAAGAKGFKACKACHSIKNGDEVIVKGGRVGPNLYGVVGRAAGSYEGYKYSKSMLAANAAGLVWTEELIAEFITNPNDFLKKFLDDPKAKSKMSKKVKKGAPDLAAYLASVAPPVAEVSN